MLIFNATPKAVSVKVFGNWFNFKPSEIKMLRDEFATFISQDRMESGLVAVSESFMNPEHKNTEEGIAELHEATKTGIRNRVAYLEKVFLNETVSLQQDLDIKNIKVNPAIFMSDRTLELLREYKDYEMSKQNEGRERAKEVSKIKKSLTRT